MNKIFSAVLAGVFLTATASVSSAAKKSDILHYLPAFIHPQSPVFGDPPRGDGRYVVIAWNDLGMHCMDPSFEDFSILPPYNNLVAQVVKRGSDPQIVSQGVSVQYRFLGNTVSSTKTNFWDYAQALFNLSSPLPQNIGLKGKGLSGVMDPAAGHFFAEGIPVTEIFDDKTRSPYQLAEVVVKDTQGNVLAGTHTVVPVSTELHCEYCHSDLGLANPSIATGVVKQNILSLHDQNEGTNLMGSRPVLCADCHSSNALGAPGSPGLPSLSRAIHNRHAGLDDGTMQGTCYKCHPGPETKCLRGAMFQAGYTCHDCHGGMAEVANSQRRPWIDEPRCAACHSAPYQENAGTLYRNSTGHHGIRCQACHGSQHAIYPSVEPLDNKQSIWLQGYAGSINSCGVCHTNRPGQKGDPHTAED
ncbi:MAG: multiheme c-type cytochrome [Desulfobulbaceae bacterium]|nr:multiheme c-type cytochrome [Desulfobulbaceae bacterium]